MTEINIQPNASYPAQELSRDDNTSHSQDLSEVAQPRIDDGVMLLQPTFPERANDHPQHETSLAQSMEELTIAAATTLPLPPSSPAHSSLPSHSPHQPRSPSSGRKLSRSPRRDGLTSSKIRPQPSAILTKKLSRSSFGRVDGSVSPHSQSRRSSFASQSSVSAGGPTFKLPAVAADLQPSRFSMSETDAAKKQFEEELQFHDLAKFPEVAADTSVIFSDACYGHRFARPRTSKSSLNTIVERPERLHAALLGVAASYVRLGHRYTIGQHQSDADQSVNHSKDVPFRLHRSTRSAPLSSTFVTDVHGVQWMNELKVMCETAESKLADNGKELARQGGGAGNGESPEKLHEGDLYLCGDSLDALEGAVGAVCDGVDAVFGGSATGIRSRKAFVCVRPPGHHCASSYPSGFCWLNNVHIGISYAARFHGLTHAAIIDFDLHHGDGSQMIAWKHNNDKATRTPRNTSSLKKASIGYFSLHDINSYPCEMGDEEKVRNASICIDGAHGQSIWNVHLQPWKDHTEFWNLYETRYSVLLDKARAFLRTNTNRLRSTPNSPQPKAAVFLSAGFDASEWEGAGMQRHKVNVPTDFYARFTKDVVAMADEAELAVGGRVISILEGGYSDRALCSGVMSHLCGLSGVKPSAVDQPKTETGLAYEMGKRIGIVANEGKQQHSPLEPTSLSLSSWWHPDRLQELEMLVNPPPPPLRKSRSGTPPTYTSTTQSFMAKVVSSTKTHRSISGSTTDGMSKSPSAGFSRAPSPPPPQFGWATATHQLCKLLIPTGRQTLSYKAEELATETRRKRERHSTIGLPATSEVSNAKGMVLRDRKGRTPNYTCEDDSLDMPVSRSDRRRTLAVPSLVVERARTTKAGEENAKRPAKGMSRRSSLVSNSTIPSYQTTRKASSPLTGEASTWLDGQRQDESVIISATSNVAKSSPRPRQEKKGKAPRQSRIGNSSAGVAQKELSTAATVDLPATSRGVEVIDNNQAPAIVTDEMLVDAPQQFPHATETSSPDELDQLALGVTRIKLNMPTKEEYEARRVGKS